MDIKERIAGEMRSMWLAGSLSICAEPRPDGFYIRAAESIIALFEPVTLEALTDEEINEIGIKVYPMTGIAGRQVDLANKVSQATIAKYGQLYRIKEG